MRMPKGVYTGFKADTSVCAENGLIALLGYPARPAKSPQHEYKIFDLIYINNQGFWFRCNYGGFATIRI